MSVYKRKTSKGETESYHYKFMQQGKFYTGTCTDCPTKVDAQKYEKHIKDNVKNILGKEEDVKSIARAYIQDKTGGETVLLDEAYSEYLKQPSKIKSSEQHTKTKESYWNDFLAYLKDKHDSIQYMDEVKTVHVSGYLGYLQKNGRYQKKIAYSTSKFSAEYKNQINNISNRTYNFVFGVLKDIFTRLSRRAGILIDPFENLYKMEKEVASREVFTEEELKKISENADDFIYPIFAIGLNTAFREGDICTLKWSDINFEAGFISRKTRKTGAKVLIPLLPSLKSYLLEQKSKSNGSEYVLPEHAEMYLSNQSGINYRVRKFLNSLGIETTKTVKGRTRKVSTKDVHSLRHTFCYQAGLKKIPLLIVKDICGHMTDEMTELYQKHATIEAKREQLRLLEGSMSFLPSVDDEYQNREKLKNIIDSLLDEDIKKLTAMAKKMQKGKSWN
jgi:integrase